MRTENKKLKQIDRFTRQNNAFFPFFFKNVFISLNERNNCVFKLNAYLCIIRIVKSFK